MPVAAFLFVAEVLGIAPNPTLSGCSSDRVSATGTTVRVTGREARAEPVRVPNGQPHSCGGRLQRGRLYRRAARHVAPSGARTFPVAFLLSEARNLRQRAKAGEVMTNQHNISRLSDLA